MALAQELKEETLIAASIEQQLRTIDRTISELSRKIEEGNGSGQDRESVEELLRTVMAKQEKNDRQLAQALKEEAVFKVQVREGMKQELDVLKEQQSGEQFNPLLKEIASIYVEYQGLLEDGSPSQQFKKNLHALFEQLEDVLGDYGAEVCRSEAGSVRQTGLSKVIEKIPTHDREEHNRIAASRRPGVMRGKMVLAREFVDVYVYDPSLKKADPEDSMIEVQNGATEDKEIPERKKVEGMELAEGKEVPENKKEQESREVPEGDPEGKECSEDKKEAESKESAEESGEVPGRKEDIEDKKEAETEGVTEKSEEDPGRKADSEDKKETLGRKGYIEESGEIPERKEASEGIGLEEGEGAPEGKGAIEGAGAIEAGAGTEKSIGANEEA